MARYRILSWRDIPAQVKVSEEGRRPLSAPLSERWQQEIDRVAMRDGLVGTDEYLAEWEWSPEVERPGSAEDVLEALVAELEASWEARRGATS
jgi:Virulence factor